MLQTLIRKGGGGQNSLDDPNSGEFPQPEEETTYTFKTYEEYFTDNNITNDITLTTIEGDGSSASPYIINSTNDFWYASKYLSWDNKYVELACDIMLNDETFDEDGNPSGGDRVVYEWKPMFKKVGFFEGKGNLIKGLHFNDETISSYTGLFAHEVEVVKNLLLSDFFVRGKGNVNVLGNRVSALENVKTLNGYVKACDSYVSGMVGVAEKITNCANMATVLSPYWGASGIVTTILTGGIVSDCVNYGDIIVDNGTSVTGRAGGITQCVTKENVTIINCKNYGEIKSTGGQTGGIVGWISASSGIIENCENYANITAFNSVGGISGSAHNQMNFIIRNCSNFGSIFCSDAARNMGGGILGQVANSGCLNIEGCKNYGYLSSNCGGEIAGDLYNNAIPENETCEVVIKNCAGYFGKSLIYQVGKVKLKVENCLIFSKSFTNPYIFATYFRVDAEVSIINFMAEVKTDQSTICFFRSVHDNRVQLNIRNVFLNICGTNFSNAEFLCMSMKEDNNVDGVVVKVNTATSLYKHYYGTDFSGFYISFKNGRIGLVGIDGRGQFSGTMDEEALQNLGFEKKTI